MSLILNELDTVAFARIDVGCGLTGDELSGLGFILRRAFGLNLPGMKDLVAVEFAISEGLRAILEGIGEGVGTGVGDLDALLIALFFLDENELDLVSDAL